MRAAKQDRPREELQTKQEPFVSQEMLMSINFYRTGRRSLMSLSAARMDRFSRRRRRDGGIGERPLIRERRGGMLNVACNARRDRRWLIAME
jgi:hypothetical protein